MCCFICTLHIPTNQNTECVPHTGTCVQNPLLELPAPAIFLNESAIGNNTLKLVFHSTLQFFNISLVFDANYANSPNHTTYCDHYLFQCSLLWKDNVAGCDVDMVATFPSLTKVLLECFHQVTNNLDNNYIYYESNVQVTTGQHRNPIRGTAIDQGRERKRER